jgi:hypothetical protein
MGCIVRVSSPVEMDKVELRGYPEILIGKNVNL